MVIKSAEKLFGSMSFSLPEDPLSVLHILIITTLSFISYLGQLLKHQNLENYFETKVPSLKEFSRTKAVANTKVPTSRLLAHVMQLLQRCVDCLLTNRGDENLGF